MDDGDIAHCMSAIKSAATRIFESAETEEDVCRLEGAIHNEVMYLAALAQSERVKPPQGWDPYGR